MVLPKEGRRYTYKEYLTWDDEIHYELIEGVPYAMAGTRLSHAAVRGELETILRTYLRDKKCRVFSETVDVLLSANENDDHDTVVKPDILVVCDPTKLRERVVVGAPDLIMEVLSRSTSRMDRITKLRLYENAGVREYWVVDPFNKVVKTYILKNKKYGDPANYEVTDTIRVHIFEDLDITLEDIFEHVEDY